MIMSMIVRMNIRAEASPMMAMSIFRRWIHMKKQMIWNRIKPKSALEKIKKMRSNTRIRKKRKNKRSKIKNKKNRMKTRILTSMLIKQPKPWQTRSIRARNRNGQNSYSILLKYLVKGRRW